MKNFSLSSLLAAAACLLATSVAFAADTPAADTSSYDIVFGTGPAGKGYFLLGDDAVKVCGGTISTQNRATKGGSDNLTLLAKGELDVALVQLGTLEDAAKDRPAYRDFRAIASVNSNLLHGLTSKSGYNFQGQAKTIKGAWYEKDKVVAGDIRHVDFNNMTDLKGYTVAAVGTAVDVLNKINTANSLGLTILDRNKAGTSITDAEAMKMVKAGEVVAMFTVSGWPHGMLKDANAENAGLTTVNFNLAPGPKQQIVTVDYDALAVRGARFVGEPNLLIAQGYEKDTDGYNHVAKFAACLMGKWKDLRNTRGMHPAWKEASDPGNTYGWPKFEWQTAATKVVKKK